jgi:transketolase
MSLVGSRIPSLAGGAADLAGSTRASLKGQGDFDYNDYPARNFHFGLREHAMGAISNGMALHGGIIPFAGTFLIFSDYMRPAVRLAAIMKLHIVYIFTHDSIGLGEDGPTHQPIEHLVSLRAMPDLHLFRPADASETVEAWKLALEWKEGPTALVLTRQNLPVFDRRILGAAVGVRKGGYILLEPKTAPQVVLIGTGSEVHIALAAARILQEKGITARVVSLPSWSLFDSQSREYRDSVLPPAVWARVSIEAGSPLGWERYVGSEGIAIGLSRFGASAPSNVLYQQFGLTPERMVQEAIKLVNK